ncbi:MAG: hypothetical protein ACUVRZ_12520 [Desulfobacca sp.]|uniref:hypothetical protein n=1 Tax=Desulfobacca sp. TaxID=2067990 RepID=UPI00404B2DBC
MQTLMQWLAAISLPAGGPGQPFQASWQYVVTALLGPALIGLAAAGVIITVEKILGTRLGGGGI